MPSWRCRLLSTVPPPGSAVPVEFLGDRRLCVQARFDRPRCRLPSERQGCAAAAPSPPRLRRLHQLQLRLERLQLLPRIGVHLALGALQLRRRRACGDLWRGTSDQLPLAMVLDTQQRFWWAAHLGQEAGKVTQHSLPVCLTAGVHCCR